MGIRVFCDMFKLGIFPRVAGVTTHVPLAVNGTFDGNIIDIGVRHSGSAALTDKGQLYIWGDFVKVLVPYPMLIQEGYNNSMPFSFIYKMAVGNMHTLLHTDKGLYGFGVNSKGQVSVNVLCNIL